MGNPEMNHGPTHVCPNCGEWFDVEPGGHDTWFVTECENESALAAHTWAEAAQRPVCPLDTTALKIFEIVDA